MLGALAWVNFNFSSLSHNNSEKEISKDFELSPGGSVYISTDVENVRIGVSSDGSAHLRYVDSDRRTHTFTCDGENLSLVADTVGDEWYKHIHISFFNFDLQKTHIELELPESFRGNVQLINRTGNTTATNLTLDGEFSSIASTGNIDVEKLTARTVNLSASTGRATMCDINSPDVTVSCTTGSVIADRVSSEKLSADTSTGNIKFNTVSAPEIKLSSTTGSISFTDLSVHKAQIRATTGSVKGNITSPISAYFITSHTSTGSNNLPETSYGGDGTLNVSTSTGDINIKFAQ